MRFFLLILLALGSTASAGELVDGVACVVNEEVITLSEIYDTAGEYVRQQCGVLVPGESNECTDQAEQEVAKTLILQSLVREKLTEVDMDVGPEDVDRTIDQIMRENGIQTREQFRTALAQQGFSWDVYRGQLTDQIRMLRFRETFLRPQISISEGEIQDAYARAVREDTGEERLQISYAVYPIDPEKGDIGALELKAELAERVQGAGDGGLDVIGEVSGITPQIRKSTYTPDQLVAELKPLLDLEPGDLGGPYRLGNSYFVVRLDQRKASAPPPLEQVRPQLEAQLMEQRLEEEAEQWYRYARRGAAVQCTFGTPE